MSVQWADDFSRYGVGATSRGPMLDGLPYALVGVNVSGIGEVQTSPDPNESVRAFRLGLESESNRDLRIALPSVITGNGGALIRAWLGQLPNSGPSEVNLIGFVTVGGNTIVNMRILQNGAVQILGRVGGTLQQVANSLNPLVSPQSFNHFEFTHDLGAGTGELFINGVSRLTWSGVDAGQTAAFVAFSPRSSAVGGWTNVWIKDLVIWDDTGTENNSPMGTVIVRRLKPNADVTLGGWTPSTGTTGFNLLAKDAPNDASFISGADSPLPAPCRFNLENLPPDVTSVRALISVVRQRKIDGGDANMQTSLTPNNGTNYALGTDRPITSAFQYDFDVSELDPATATPWSPSAVDATQQRLNRTV